MLYNNDTVVINFKLKKMLDQLLVDFCKAENVTLFQEPMTVIFKTRSFPQAKGLIIGYKGFQLAVTMGPEEKTVFQMNIPFLVQYTEKMAENSELKLYNK